MPTLSPLTHEPINDIPLLLHLLHDVLKLDIIVDKVCPRHGNWQGLSLGQVAVTWLAHILSEHHHFMSHVEDWAERVPTLLNGWWGQPVRRTDFSDDRLAEVTRVLSLEEVWQAVEAQVTAQMIRVYDLRVARVRLDGTTASVYGGNALSVLFRHGHSKDHRPDLRQLKVMLAALDPLGVVVGADVVPGNVADDGLYVPLIARLRATLPSQGLLYIGDAKMGALATRAYVHGSGNHYLMPLAQVGQVPDDLAQWVTDALKGKVTLTPIRDEAEDTPLAEGYELRRRVSAETETGVLTWTERVLVVHSKAYAEAAIRGLRERVTRTEAALRALTPPRGRGQRQYTDRAAVQADVDHLLADAQMAEVLQVSLTQEVERRPVRAYRGTPAHTRERRRYVVQVKRREKQIRAQEERLGWRVYATNAPATRLPLPQAIQAYRDEYLIERNCARLKGRPLSLRPIWIKRDDHALGLTRLLTLAARVLALAESHVRQRLAEAQRSLAGLYPGQASRVTALPTTERLLQAFNQVILTVVHKGTQTFFHLTPLSDLQRTILRDLGCPRNLYQRWLPPSWKPLKI